MAYDGNGNFIRVHNWTADAANGLDINAGEMDAEDNGFATGLSNCVTRDGQGKMSVDFLPNADNTLNLGSGSFRWATLNGVAIPSGNNPWTIYPRTPAEILASVTPVSLSFLPGDLRRFATFTTGGGDVTTALASAVAQATKAGGAPIYVPAAMGALTVTAGVSVTAPIKIFGDDWQSSVISTAADITILSFTVAASGSLLSDFQFVGKGADATLPAILLTNSNNNFFQRVCVKSFGIGIQFVPGLTGNKSCFSNTLSGCRIISNITINIDAQAGTNALFLDGTTFGGGPCATGLRLVDANNLTILGGDVEGMTLCAIDLDATSTLPAGHTINGLHIEGNTSSAGDIRIGNTAPVNGVHIMAAFYPGTGAIAGINAVNCNGLFIRFALGAGYTNVPFLQKTNLTNEDVTPIGPVTNGLNYRQNNAKFNYADQSVLDFAAATAFDAAYQDSANYNQYRIQSGSVAANKDYYAGLDAIEMTATTAPGAGAKLYARGMFASNDLGGATKVGAAFMSGDVDIVGGRFAPPTPAFGAQVGAVFQGSGVPSNTNGNNGDIYFRTDTPATANQRIYVKSAGAWIAIL